MLALSVILTGLSFLSAQPGAAQVNDFIAVGTDMSHALPSLREWR
jgi:hypothetical protein